MLDVGCWMLEALLPFAFSVLPSPFSPLPSPSPPPPPPSAPLPSPFSRPQTTNAAPIAPPASPAAAGRYIRLNGDRRYTFPLATEFMAQPPDKARFAQWYFLWSELSKAKKASS